ncbi:MAG TPA: hypothetical protein VMZ25_09610 [Terriglobales bacterium]|nr:hypothetical protein [Terriglobales bacterium]
MKPVFQRPLLFVLFIATLPFSFGQNIFTEGLKGNIPTVRFNFENPGLKPATYEISIDAAGGAEYVTRDEASAGSDGVHRRFEVSKATRNRIFELTEVLRQFRGDYEFRKHRVAFTGHKTLTYTEGAEQYSTRYNWSENRDITELTAIFQGIANTLQAEARLASLRKYDKLGLDAELKSMESQAKGGGLKELQIISKLLNDIKRDPAVMRMARDRAERLLQLAGN